jgi:DNA polymerase elongation subunit (family B)
MFINAFYDTKRSIMHLFEQVEGEKETHHDEIPWTPYVFLPSKESDIKTIYGKSVHKKTFDSYFDYHKFCKTHDASHIYENNAKFETQFLAERYHGIPDEDIYVPPLKVYYIDIEVFADKGFPDHKDPKDPITAISIRNSYTSKTVVFAYNHLNIETRYTGNRDWLYVHCDTEEELMRKFLGYMEKYPCDVMSGWNIWAFDLPYIINKSKKIWGEKEGKEMYSKMSPIRFVNVWKQKLSDDINIDMGGLTILDYYNVYRWYGKKLERYTLEYVCQKELGEGKHDYSQYKDLTELMQKDWNTYIDYNAIDCKRVHELEDKLGYIRMIQALSLLCKAPMKYYNAQTQLIDGLMLTHYRRNKLCAPHFYGGEQEAFKAAHVKDPHIGLHEWVVDVDITSSYPSHIITLNMSLETFVGKVSAMPEFQVVKSVANREFPEFKMLKEDKGEWKVVKVEGEKLDKFNLALQRGLLAIAPNGSIFSTNKEGVVAHVEKNVFFKRNSEVKPRSKEFFKKANECEDEEQKRKFNERGKELDSLQKALKIMMNAFFGIMSVPYSRYFNVHIASAITAGGRHTIKRGEVFCNELLNSPNEELIDILKDLGFIGAPPTLNKDYVHYIDTDSLFVGLGEWIKDYGLDNAWDNFTKDEKIMWIKKISRVIEKYIDDRIFKEVQIRDYNSQVHDFKIGFKQEIIAQTALFVKKKKYSYYLVDEEGVPKDELKTTGLEIVRSDSSEAIRPRLKKIMEMIVKQERDEKIAAEIRRCRKELKEMSPEDLAANVGINNIRKYLTGTIKKGDFWEEEKKTNFVTDIFRPKKGTPWHVKGVYNYRVLLEALDIQDKYEDIYEGLKAKVIYVKKNPFDIDIVTFQEWPKEFDNVIQFDYETMIEKFFINKIRTLLEPLDKEHIIDRDDAKLDVFF